MVAENNMVCLVCEHILITSFICSAKYSSNILKKQCIICTISDSISNTHTYQTSNIALTFRYLRHLLLWLFGIRGTYCFDFYVSEALIAVTFRYQRHLLLWLFGTRGTYCFDFPVSEALDLDRIYCTHMLQFQMLTDWHFCI